MPTDGPMPSSTQRESVGSFQQRVAAALKEAGHTIKGCQLVLNDFKILLAYLTTGASSEVIDDYLLRCRATYLDRGWKYDSLANHVLVLEGDVLAESTHLMGIRRARDRWRLTGQVHALRGGCSMD